MAATIRSALFLSFALVAAMASATTIELSAGPGRVAAPQAAWIGQGRSLAAPDHVLEPQLVATAAGLVLSVELPREGRLTFVPTGIAAGGASPTRRVREPSRPLRTLPAGSPRLLVEADGSALAQETWFGVDEQVTLRDGEIKHDLLVDRGALFALGEGDIVATWSLELPAGVRAALDDGLGVTLRSASGKFLARIPAPDVADADDEHYTRGVARLALAGSASAPGLSLVVPESWARSPDRALPLRLDPTISLQPTANAKTGWVDETGFRNDGVMVSGSLAQVGFGTDARAFAEFDTSAIPDGATIVDTVLHVWLDNHDNESPGLEQAGSIPMEIKAVATRVNIPAPALHAAIAPHGSGPVYVATDVVRTGPHFCRDSFRLDDYDLGPSADADLQAQLPLDFFTLGFTSTLDTIFPFPPFDHLDYIGFPELVVNQCGDPPDFPGTRITLDVEYLLAAPPVCDAGGPYLSDCPSMPFTLDGTGSSDPDGDPLTYSWTTSCDGTIANADQAVATLQLDAACSASCEVTLAVSDGRSIVSCTAPVSAEDLTPPEITGRALIDLCLWPPRHDLYCLEDPRAYVVAQDACQAGLKVRFLGCPFDQPDEARRPGRPENGDGHFTDDCQVSPDGQEICIRAERAGHDPVGGRNTFDGRHYKIGIEVDDGCGNSVIVGGTVIVPHDRRDGALGQDDPCVSGNRRRR